MSISENTVQNHIHELDTGRALGIILVVVGHVIEHYNHNYVNFGGWRIVYDFIYSFHMPFFFCLSGLVYFQSRYVPKKMSDYLLHYIPGKIRRILIPYLFFSFLVLGTRLLSTFFADRHQSFNIPEAFLKIIINPHLGYSPYLWFLHGLFIIFIVAPVIDLIFIRINKYIGISIICSVFTIGCFQRNALLYDLMTKGIFFFVGMQAGRDIFKTLRRVQRYGAYCLFLFLLSFALVKIKIFIAPFVIINLLLASLGTIAFLWMSMVINKKFYRLGLVKRIFMTISRYSLDIYLIQYLGGVYSIGFVYYVLLKTPLKVSPLFLVVFLPPIIIISSIFISKYLISRIPFIGPRLLGRTT
jgi:fucose 4-O-acetylase-like acetyltransferase